MARARALRRPFTERRPHPERHGTSRIGWLRAAVLGAELSDAEQAATLVPRTVEALGRVDVVVNNAGLARDNLALRMSDADWRAVIDVDLTAAFVICRAALRPMLKQRWGRIVNVSSISGVMGNPGQATAGPTRRRPCRR